MCGARIWQLLNMLSLANEYRLSSSKKRNESAHERESGARGGGEGHKIGKGTTGERGGDDGREILLFEAVNFGLRVSGHIGGRYLGGGLEEYFSAIALLADLVYGDAALALAGGYHGFVNVVAVHAASAEFGQQRRVNVNDATGIAGNEKRGHHEQKSSQHYGIDGVTVHYGKQGGGVVELCLGHEFGGHAQMFGTLHHAGFGTVAEHYGYLPTDAIGVKKADDVFGIGTVAGG